MASKQATLVGVGLVLLLVVATLALPQAVAAASRTGYRCYYWNGGYAATCCTYYSNGNYGCQDYYWACDGNGQAENRSCYWHKRGGYYEPNGCLVFVDPITGQTTYVPIPEPLDGLLIAATDSLNGDIDSPAVPVPEPVFALVPEALPLPTLP